VRRAHQRMRRAWEARAANVCPRERPSGAVMNELKQKRQRVTLRKKAAAEAREKTAGASRLGSYREKLDWEWVCARVRGRGVPESDVEDVAQVVVIAMSRAEKKLELRPGQVERNVRRAVLRKIIGYRVANYRRDRARFHRMRLKLAWSADTEATTAPSPEVLVVQKERHTSLHAALDRMTHMVGAYQVVMLNGLDEMPMRDVVVLLGIPEGTGFGRMLRAKQVLREALLLDEMTERTAA
jgi:DNA-directed RNA polymerase specialized sigma24 family protein